MRSLREYRNLYVVQHRLGGRLIYPESLKYLALYILSLCKTLALRGGYVEASLDEHCAAGYSMMILPIGGMLKLLYPTLVRIDEILLKVINLYLILLISIVKNIEFLDLIFMWQGENFRDVNSVLKIFFWVSCLYIKWLTFGLQAPDNSELLNELKPLPLTKESLDAGGLYLYNDGFSLILWCGRMLSADIVKNILGIDFSTSPDLSKVFLLSFLDYKICV